VGLTARTARRAPRHLLVAAFVLAYLAAGGVTLLLGSGLAGLGLGSFVPLAVVALASAARRR
jgi:hypothetical protein